MSPNVKSFNVLRAGPSVVLAGIAAIGCGGAGPSPAPGAAVAEDYYTIALVSEVFPTSDPMNVVTLYAIKVNVTPAPPEPVEGLIAESRILFDRGESICVTKKSLDLSDRPLYWEPAYRAIDAMVRVDCNALGRIKRGEPR